MLINKKVNKTKKKNNIAINSTTHYEHLSEPWFSLITLGLKTIEGRLNKGRFASMKVGDIIIWHNEDFKAREIYTKIVAKRTYKCFSEYLKEEGLKNCLPGILSLEHGLSVYYKYFTRADEDKYGIIAIEIKLLNNKWLPKK